MLEEVGATRGTAEGIFCLHSLMSNSFPNWLSLLQNRKYCTASQLFLFNLY